MTRRPELARWYADLGGRLAAPAEVLILGDSNDEGYGAKTLRRRWQTLLQRTLRSRAGITWGAEFPYIPGMYNRPYPAQPVEQAGPVTEADQFGVGKRCARVDGDGAVTFTWTGTSARLLLTRGSVAGLVHVVVDGQLRATLDTYQAAGSSVEHWHTGALPAGVHHITVARAPGSTGRAYVEGLITYNGDEWSGIRTIDSSHGGLSAYSFAPETAWAESLCDPGTGDLSRFALLLYGLGTNDYAAGRTAGQLADDTARVTATLRARGFTGSIVYLHKWKAYGRDQSRWDSYRDAFVQLAAGDPHALALDLQQIMPDPESADGSCADGLYVDTVHLSDRGHGVVADALASLLIP